MAYLTPNPFHFDKLNAKPKGKGSEGREATVWKCKHCGGAMGVVMRNGSGIRQLLLYRQAINIDKSTNSGQAASGRGEVARELYGDWDGEGRREDEPDVMAVVEGYVADVRCSLCGRVRTWVPGPEAIRRMMRSFDSDGERRRSG